MNRWTLSFPRRIDYSAHDEITVGIDLINVAFSVSVDAKLDTGSKCCIFQPRYARWLNLNLADGVPQRFRTAMGSFTGYGHEVALSVGDLQWTTTVYFAEPENFPINVVGRTGFLDHLQIALVDYEQQLFLSPYETG